MTKGAKKPGLYANIHAKQKRIKAGSGERMRKPGSKGAPTAKAFRDSKTSIRKRGIKLLSGGSTILERGIAAEVRELHPLADREGVKGSEWNATRSGKFNTLLNNVVHDKTGEPYNKEAMKIIKSVARTGRFTEYGRAQTVPEEMLRSNEQSKQLVESFIEAIKNPKQKKIDPPPAAVVVPVKTEPVKNEEPEEPEQDENQAPKISGSGRSRGDEWHRGQNRRYV
jgi:hypothetical protein